LIVPAFKQDLLLPNIMLSCKNFPGTDTPAYMAIASVTMNKSFNKHRLQGALQFILNSYN